MAHTDLVRHGHHLHRRAVQAGDEAHVREGRGADEEGLTLPGAVLYLVRHAQSPFSPDEMRDLSAAGHAAAARVADLLAGAGITRIVSSPYTRAIQTVQPLADRLGLTIEIEPDLRERHLCDDVVDDPERRIAQVWRDFTFAFPNGESSAAAQQRVRAAVDRIAREAAGRAVAISSHGNALALLLQTFDPAVDFAFWSRMSKPDVYVVSDAYDGRPFRRLWTEEATP